MAGKTEKKQEKRFEAAIAELETIVTRLESEEVPLEDAIALFDKGIGLSKLCGAKLEEAEKKVDELLKELGKEEPSPPVT